MIKPEIGKFYWVLLDGALVIAKYSRADVFHLLDGPNHISWAKAAICKVIKVIEPPSVVTGSEYSNGSFEELKKRIEEFEAKLAEKEKAESKPLADIWDSLGDDAKLARFEDRLASIEMKLHDHGVLIRRLESEVKL